MKRLNNSNFVHIQDVIEGLNFNYDENKAENLEALAAYWKDIIGEKISKLSKIIEYPINNILTVSCADSYVSSELYLVKNELINKMNDKTQKMGIEIKDIKFDYKKWKE